MKKSFIIIGLLAVSFGTKVQAQETEVAATSDLEFHRVEFGLRFMPTISTFNMQAPGGGTIEGEATLGYGVGAMLGFNFTNHIGLAGEVIYNSLSQKYKDQDMDREINVQYVNIPLLLSLNTGKANPVNLKVEAGPQMGYNLGASFTSAGGENTDTLITVLSAKSSDFGFAYGAGLELTLNSRKTIRLDLGFRGVYGLINITDATKPAEGTQYLLEGASVRTNSAYIGFTALF